MSSSSEQTLTSTEARLKRLEAIEAIRNLVHLYAFHCDNGYDGASWSQLFAEDGSFDAHGLGSAQGRDELRDYMNSLPQELHWAYHYMANEVIEVADDAESGSATWLIWEPASMASANPDLDDAVFIMGAYRGEARIIDGEWKFTDVGVEMKHVSNLDQGWVRQPFRETNIGS